MRQIQKIVIKERNVKKSLAFIFFICCTGFGVSQNTIEGKYYVDNNPSYVVDGGEYTYYEFFKDGMFEKQMSGELGLISYAQGDYKLSKDQLILNYNKTVPLKMSYHVSEIWESNKDSISVDFDLFDFDGNPAAGVDVFYNSGLSQKGYKTETSNVDGVVSFKLERATNELQFGISSMDYGLTTSILHAFYYLTIYQEWNYKVSVYLQKSYTGIPVLNRTDTLELKKVRKNFFEVINENGSVTTWRKKED